MPTRGCTLRFGRSLKQSIFEVHRNRKVLSLPFFSFEKVKIRKSSIVTLVTITFWGALFDALSIQTASHAPWLVIATIKRVFLPALRSKGFF